MNDSTTADRTASVNEGIILSGYSASPAYRRWDEKIEREYYDGLAAMPGLRGLELPWVDGIHAHDPPWLERNLRSSWDLVVTGIVAIWLAGQTDPTIGLASETEPGRGAAVQLAREMAAGVAQLNSIQGRSAVVAVQLHSAPIRPGAESSSTAFALSLAELAELDWHGARVVIEHADALRPGQDARKGFLTIEEELTAVHGLSDDRFGVSINWGRSAIDLRSGDSVAAQVASARASGLLRGVTFSGAAPNDNPMGAAWADTHLPLHSSLAGEFGEASSLLTAERIRSASAAMGPDLDFVGLKVSWYADQPAAPTRLAVVERNLTALSAALGSGPIGNS